MDFSFIEHIDIPRNEVFFLLRDHLPDIAPFIPDIDRVEIEERVEEGDCIRFVNRWHADYEVPRVARAIIKPNMMTWIDHNLWNETEWSCEWTFEPPAFSDAVACKGINTYVELDDGTCELRSEGDFSLDLSQIRGVPRLFQGRVARQVEKVMVKLVGPNLSRLAEGIRLYYKDKE